MKFLEEITSQSLLDKNTQKLLSQSLPNCFQMKIHVNSHYNNCFQTKMHEKSYHNYFPIASRRKYTKHLITINSKLLPGENTCKFSLQQFGSDCNENLHVFSTGSNLELIVMRFFVYFRLEAIIVMRIYMYFHLGAIWN